MKRKIKKKILNPMLLRWALYTVINVLLAFTIFILNSEFYYLIFPFKKRNNLTNFRNRKSIRVQNTAKLNRQKTEIKFHFIKKNPFCSKMKLTKKGKNKVLISNILWKWNNNNNNNNIVEYSRYYKFIMDMVRTSLCAIEFTNTKGVSDCDFIYIIFSYGVSFIVMMATTNDWLFHCNQIFMSERVWEREKKKALIYFFACYYKIILKKNKIKWSTPLFCLWFGK